MHKIDSAGNDNGRFVAGDPIAGTPPTHYTADWSNAVQEEIANVIIEAGIDLDKADNTQLLLAINALIDAKLANLTIAPPSSVDGTRFYVSEDADLIYESDGQYAPLDGVDFEIQNDDLYASSATELPAMDINNAGELEIDDGNN